MYRMKFPDLWVLQRTGYVWAQGSEDGEGGSLITSVPFSWYARPEGSHRVIAICSDVAPRCLCLASSLNLRYLYFGPSFLRTVRVAGIQTSGPLR